MRVLGNVNIGDLVVYFVVYFSTMSKPAPTMPEKSALMPEKSVQKSQV
jgi:hypothetical protein